MNSFSCEIHSEVVSQREVHTLRLAHSLGSGRCSDTFYCSMIDTCKLTPPSRQSLGYDKKNIMRKMKLFSKEKTLSLLPL